MFCSDVSVPEKDREKRARVAAENKKKLLNPLVFVGATRLSFRNLSKSLSDEQLKVLCGRAVKSGLAKGLVGEHDLRALHLSEGNARPTKEDLTVPTHSPRAVKKAKIRLDMDRAKDGKPQSKGFGFVEFAHHAHALACLRELNNNPEYVTFASDGTGSVEDAAVRSLTKARLIVEFSLEDKRKVMMLEARDKRNSLVAERLKAEREAAVVAEKVEGKQPKRKREDNKTTKVADGVEPPKLKHPRREDLTPAARKRKQDQRRREKEHKRKMAKTS